LGVKEGALVKKQRLRKKTKRLESYGLRFAALGEAHPRAKLTDAEVDQMRALYEEGLYGYRTLAKTFKCSRNTVKCIVKYRRRNTTPMGYRTVCMVPPRRK
jgi:DNA invertase Pin-like site-specific DNA recombinase